LAFLRAVLTNAEVGDGRNIEDRWLKYAMAKGLRGACFFENMSCRFLKSFQK